MDRAERTGLGFAVLLHAALFAALSLNLLKPPPLPKLETTPIEVTLSDEVAPVSTAPVIAPAPAPPVTQPVIEPVAPPPAPAPMQRPAPQPLPRPAKPVVQPRPAAKPVARPVANPAKPTARPSPPQRRPGLSRDLVSGLRDTPSRAGTSQPAAGAPAKAVSAAVKSSLRAEVYRQLKRHYVPPAGADVELLRVTVVIKLKADGTLAAAPQPLELKGGNDSNRPQQRLFVDQAVKAVRLASPFKLPAEYYQEWREFPANFTAELAR